MERISQGFLLNLAIASTSAVGIYDILSDIIFGELLIYNLIFNSLFFLPLIFRGKRALFAYALASIAFGIFQLLGTLIVLVQKSNDFESLHNKALTAFIVPLIGVYFIFCGIIFLKSSSSIPRQLSENV